MLATAILVLTVVVLLYKYWISNYKYWDEMGVPSIPGNFPLGSSNRLTGFQEFQGYILNKFYEKFPSSPYFGLYMMRTPVLIIRDPECFQLVLVKEFSSFRDRLIAKIPESDMLSQHLVNLDGDRWRALRNKLSPTFTSGRIKAMFPIFLKCSEAFDSLLQSHVGTAIDVKELSSRYTTDMICNCAFGLDINSMGDDSSDFIKLGKNIIHIDLKLAFSFMLLFTFPKLAEYFNLRCTPEKEETQLYVYKLVKETVKQREENGIKRKDFLDLLIQLKNKGQLEDERKENENDDNIPPFEMTMERVAAQCFVFFLAGYETSSSINTFCMYELALNPPMQARLQREIDEMIQLHAGVTYAAVKEMTYLDMIVSETMRKYPTIPAMTRVCTKTVTMPNGDQIKKGQVVFLPVWSLHHDPLYFPDPEKFDPERFSAENKESINPFAYLPFGEGPRFCIGKRFGLLQSKIGLITVFRKYSVEPCESTPIPLIMGKQPLTAPKDVIKLKLVNRKLH